MLFDPISANPLQSYFFTYRFLSSTISLFICSALSFSSMLFISTQHLTLIFNSFFSFLFSSYSKLAEGYSRRLPALGIQFWFQVKCWPGVSLGISNMLTVFSLYTTYTTKCIIVGVKSVPVKIVKRCFSKGHYAEAMAKSKEYSEKIPWISFDFFFNVSK